MASSSSSNGNANSAPHNLPLGFKFCPSEDILIEYLRQRILGGRALPVDVIPTIDLYELNPNQIPFDKFKRGVQGEWIFFTTRTSTDLITENGYWHPITVPIEIKQENRIIGFKQIFTFYWGIKPEGEKSNFLIHEYKLNDAEVQSYNRVVCRVRNMEEFIVDQDDCEDLETFIRYQDQEDSEDED